MRASSYPLDGGVGAVVVSILRTGRCPRRYKVSNQALVVLMLKYRLRFAQWLVSRYFVAATN